MRDDNDAFRASFRCVEGGVGGLRPECDFCPRRLPGFGDKKLLGPAAGGTRASKVCDLVGLGGGDDERLSR